MVGSPYTPFPCFDPARPPTLVEGSEMPRGFPVADMPAQIGRFRVIRHVGQGGMGDVFLGHDDTLDRQVAIKVPRADAVRSLETRNRLLREARLVAGLSHPNLVQVYEAGLWQDQCFVASQWAPVGDLASVLANHTAGRNLSWTVDLLVQIAEVLAYCHKNSVVHLDLKPANILFDEPNEADLATERHYFSLPLPSNVLLTDFGLARVIRCDLEQTLPNLALGTPLYMAPEQIEENQAAIGPQTDVFAFGIVMHQMLYGRRPFAGRSAVQVLDHIRSRPSPRMPTEPNVPRPLRMICQRCLMTRSEDRYATAAEVWNDLDLFRQDQPLRVKSQPLKVRLQRWCREPARLRDAGMISIGLQTALLLALSMLIAVKFLGTGDLVPEKLAVLVRDIGGIIMFWSLPTLLLAAASLRDVRAFWVHSWLALLLVVAGILAASNQYSPLNLFWGDPAAYFVLHLSITIIAAVQLAANLVAVPAALRPGVLRALPS